MTWTLFHDMHSGGGTKEEPFEKIYIEVPQAEAELVFYNRFHHNPYRVTCSCCGEDYSVTEYESLNEATAGERGCEYVNTDKAGNEITQEQWRALPLGERGRGHYVERHGPRSFNKYVPLGKYLERDNVLVIYTENIKPEERTGTLPTQGYVWVD